MRDAREDSTIPVDLENLPAPFSHQPVMLKEILETFRLLEDGLFIDATIGGGGHAEALLAAAPQRELVGIDRDQSAVEAVSARLKRFGDRFEVHHRRRAVVAEPQALGILQKKRRASFLRSAFPMFVPSLSW